MILAGLRSPMCIYMGSARDRNVLYQFFQELTEYLIRKGVKNHQLVSDRLYRRYVRFADMDETFQIMKRAEDDFIAESPETREEYRVFFDALYDGVEEVKYLLEIGSKEEDENRLQTGLLEMPYEIEEQMLPSEYYDDLPEDAEPVWMRTDRLPPIEETLAKYGK